FAADVGTERLRRVVRDVASRIGSPVFCIEGLDDIAGPLPTVVGHLLQRQGATVATAESCTGGRVAAELTGVPGSSAWFTEGVVTYSNASKVRQVGVSADTLSTHGAVSQPVAEQMATGVRERAGTTFGLATTGIAGPDGGTLDKPVGTVHIALSTPDRVHHRKLHLGGDRQRIQSLSAAGVLDLLRRHLQGLL
ncbi:MAG: nicotinamide-nucleotide amidase, partial [Kiritimatiellia bacterium]